MSTATPKSRLAQMPRIGRASRTLGRLWQVPTFLAGLGIFLAVAVSAPMRRDPAMVQFEEDVRKLRSGLAPGGDPPDVLIARSENILARLPKFTRKSGEVHFLVGSAYYRQAERSPEPEGKDARAKAIQHLEEAYSRGGVPVEDGPALAYRLGWSLYHQSGKEKDLKRVIELIRTSLEKGADSPALAYGILIQAHLKMMPPDLEGALAASQKQLEMTDDRNVPAMAQARLTNAELLLKCDRRPEAIDELERIGSTTPSEIRIPARIIQAEACAAEGLFNKAVLLWKELLADAADVPGGKARVLYHLGCAHQNSEPADPEAAAQAWEEALASGGPEGSAAGLRLGQLRMTGGVPDSARALEHWTLALANVRMAGDYDARFVSLSDTRSWLENGFKTLIELQDYGRAEQLALLYQKLAEAGRAEQLQAEALFALASDAKERVKTQPMSAAGKKLEEIRAEFHRAAVAYDQAASLLKDPAPVLWQASVSYLEANNPAHAARCLTRFVNIERDETRLAEAYLVLAEAHAALGEKEKSLLAYYKCIEYPSTPFAHRARYQVAIEEIEKKNFDQARDILEQILKNPSPMLDRTVHEKAIYKMAGLLLQMKQYSQAVVYLKEAARQYPANKLSLAARDQLADSYRRMADQEKLKLESSKNDEHIRHYRRKRNDLLDQVHLTYQAVAEELEARARMAELSGEEKSILRRALFGSADARFDMNELNEALRLYQGIQARHRKKIESLLASQRIYKCVGVMIEPAQIKLVHAAAIQSVSNAREDLAALPADADVFQGTGVWTKEDWTSRLQEWLERLNPSVVAPKSSGPIIR